MQKKELLQLIRKAKAKDLYRVAISILMNDEDAADAIQDTILGCWEKLQTLKEEKYFKTWITRVLINRCYDIRKKQQWITVLEEYEEPSAEDQYNVEWKEALGQLDEKYRIVGEDENAQNGWVNMDGSFYDGIISNNNGEPVYEDGTPLASGWKM